MGAARRRVAEYSCRELGPAYEGQTGVGRLQAIPCGPQGSRDGAKVQPKTGRLALRCSRLGLVQQVEKLT